MKVNLLTDNVSVDGRSINYSTLMIERKYIVMATWTKKIDASQSILWVQHDLTYDASGSRDGGRA